MDQGKIDVRVLPDGRVRAETGDMAGPSHLAADNFLTYLQALMGGEVVRTKAAEAHHHHDHHHHGHGHESA